jgi:dipeptidase E
MNQLIRRIIAVGGGGFLMDDTRGVQERYVLSLCRESTSRRVLFLGTASGDAATAQLKFFRLFADLGCKPSTLPFFPYEMKRDYVAAAREADLIYVGGGNTPAMIAVWREFGFDRALRDAYEAGTVLAGISAGANCWFQHYVTDSVPGGGVPEGLGWLRGTFCPHLDRDSEAWRQPVLAVQPTPAVGAGEHVMFCYENEQWKEAVHSSSKIALCMRKESTDSELRSMNPRELTS